MEAFDTTSWRNLGISVAFQPFDWQMAVERHLGDVQILIGPLTISVGWPSH